MKINLKINKITKTITLLKDSVNGESFTLLTAIKLFELEDDGYTLVPTSRAINKKLQGHEIAHWRRKHCSRNL